MKNDLVASVRALAVFTLLTGVAYPLLITVGGNLLFGAGAQGSLVMRDGKVIGSSLIAQKTDLPRYFQPRPSAADYGTVSSGASNLAPTSAALKTAVADRRAALGPGAPADLLTASGSGLDPHISPEAAAFQVSRVSQARRLSPDRQAELARLVADHVEPPTFGFLGGARVNVLRLNIELDQRFGE